DVHSRQSRHEAAPARRANSGGMTGNTSAGSRSIVYGKTIEHVRRLGEVLANGMQTNFGPISPAEWDRRAAARSLEGSIYRHVRRIIRENAEEIRQRFPPLLRRVSGYNLDVLCTGLAQVPLTQPSPPVAGGEGWVRESNG